MNTSILIDGLRLSPMVLSDLVQSIPNDKMDVRRGEGFWTVSEHLSHLAQVQPMLLDRMKRFVAEETPEFVPYIPGDEDDEPDTPETMDPTQALTQFTSVREVQLALMKDMDSQVWQRSAVHPEYEQYTFLILVRHILMHDHWHMYRMEELWLTKDAYLTRLE